jgi:Fe-S cluster biogenesis protein NfuA
MAENVEKQAVEACLDKIRPYIQHDGGDIELLGVDELNVVYVSFKGACAGCMMAADDFSGGIKELLMDEVPGIRDVVLVG